MLNRKWGYICEGQIRKLVLSVCLIMVVVGMATGCPALPIAAAISTNLPGPVNPWPLQPRGSLTNRVDGSIDTPVPSCANPTRDVVRKCEEIEHQILASTVRIELNLWVKNGDSNDYFRLDRTGLATIKNGRYLVTHNHGGLSQSDLTGNRLNRVSIFTANGVPRLVNGPLNTVTIATEDTETLVLDFGVYGGQGLFAMIGVSSAEFKAWESLPLRPGMEVAQVTWDGEAASVDWVTIDDIIAESGTPRLELNNTVRSGTSGGGVFWNGYHIANSWSQNTLLNVSSGMVARQYSVVALNSPQIATRY